MLTHTMPRFVFVVLLALPLTGCQEFSSEDVSAGEFDALNKAFNAKAPPTTAGPTALSTARQDRDARIALARVRCDAAARRLISGLQRIEADIDRFGVQWRHIQNNLHQLSMHIPGSGMSIRYPDVDFPQHAKDIRAAAHHFELEFMRCVSDVKDAWILCLRDTRGLAATERDSLPEDADFSMPEDPAKSLLSESTQQAAHIFVNLDAYLEAIDQKYHKVMAN